jgi:hypothetical protein
VKIPTLIFFLFCFGVASAQFNDTVNYFVRHSSTGILNKTNDRNAFVLNNALRFSFYKRNVSLNTSNSWIYGKQQGELSNNDFTSAVDVDLFKSRKHIYYWGLLHYEKSFSLKINHRFQGGVGVGYYLLDREHFVVQVSDGILFEKSDLLIDETPDLAYETYRNSLRLKFRFTHRDMFTLEGTDFVQHSLSDKSDYIIRSSTNFSVKLWKWVSLTLVVNYNKLALTNRENFLLNYGVTLEKYF